MNTKEIIKDWLKTNGYDGLHRDKGKNNKCSCRVDTLFLNCTDCIFDRLYSDCKAGYKQNNGGIGEVCDES